MHSKPRDRRAEPRLAAAALLIERATLRPGYPVDVVDLSANGVQVQSDRQLRPGLRIQVRLAAGNRTLDVAGHIVRCTVWALHADGVTYRGAVRFEEACQSFWDDQARVGEALAITSRGSGPPAGVVG